MKRLVSALILGIIITAAHFSGTLYINKVIEESNILVEECIESYKNEKTPIGEAQKLKNYWSQKEDLLSVFAHHDTIDNIEMAIDNLVVYSKTKNSEIFYEYSGTVKTLLHQLKEDNSITMHSVL